MKQTRPFGIGFAEKMTAPVINVPYDATTQTAAISDESLQLLAASDNTLTGTGGDDNDFDE